MRTSFPVIALASLLALPAAAQLCPDEFRGGGGALPPEEADVAIAPGLFLMLPVNGATDVPLNAELRVSGSMGPDMVAILEDPDGVQVPFTLEGSKLIPDALLAPNTVYSFYSDFVETPCGRGCFGLNEFTTGTAIDETAPQLIEVPSAHVMLNDICDFGSGHSIMVDFVERSSDVAWVEIASLLPGATPRKSFAGPLFGTDELFLGGDQTPIALDDVVRLAFTPMDLAGNVGDAVIVRTPARSRDVFDDAGNTIANLPRVQCTLSPESRPGLVGEVPTSGLVEVDFAFEATPVALTDGEREVDLIPVEDTPRGQRMLPAEDLEPGTWSLVAKPCAFCACAGCALQAEGELTVAALDDAAAPEAPVVLELDELVDPAFSEGQCVPDQTALLVRIEPGVDDGTAPEDLRYHATVRVDDALPLQVGRLLAPEVDGDTHLLRLDTASFGALLGEDLEIELVAVDLADNTSSVGSHTHGAVATGCSAHGVPDTGAPFAGLALLGLAVALRRRRA